MPTTSLMDDGGEVIRRYELIRPMASEKMLRLEFEASHWEPASDADFERAWTEEVGQIPELTKTRITLVSGLLLPIWERLPSENMRVYRLEAHDGERVIGRLVTQEQLAQVFAALGLDCTIEMAAGDVLEAITERRAVIHLAGGLSLRRARVMDRERVEVVGCGPTQLGCFKALGCYTEIIAWKTRLFLPANDEKVIADLLQRHRIVATPEAA